MVILDLIPLLAQFCPERFFEDHLVAAMRIILSVAREDHMVDTSEVFSSFRSLKGLALCLHNLGNANASSLMSWMPQISERLMSSLETLADVQMHQETLECCAVLAQCLQEEWKSYAEQLLMPMIRTGVSHSLVNCLKHVRLRTMCVRMHRWVYCRHWKACPNLPLRFTNSY